VQEGLLPAQPLPVQALAGARGPAAGQDEVFEEIAKTGASPEAWQKLSEAMTLGAGAQGTKENNMINVQRKSLGVYMALTEKSEMSSTAKQAHIEASDMHATAEEETILAAKLRQKANDAVVAMKRAKAVLDNETKNEFDERESTATQKKKEKEQQVLYETAEYENDKKQASLKRAQDQLSAAKGAKEKQDNIVLDAEKDNEAAIEAQDAAVNDMEERLNYKDAAATKLAQIKTAFLQAEREKEASVAEAGEKEAEAKAAKVSYDNAMANRDQAYKSYNVKFERAHEVSNHAAEAEARAEGAVQNAREAATGANQLSSKAQEMPRASS